jgi:hypothetical protein
MMWENIYEECMSQNHHGLKTLKFVFGEVFFSKMVLYMAIHSHLCWVVYPNEFYTSILMEVNLDTSKFEG